MSLSGSEGGRLRQGGKALLETTGVITPNARGLAFHSRVVQGLQSRGW